MRSDGPRRRVVCLTVVGEPLMDAGPMLKYLPISGNCAEHGVLDREFVVLPVIPARNS